MSARSLGLDNWAQNLRGWPLASARARFARQAPELPVGFDPLVDAVEDVMVSIALDAQDGRIDVDYPSIVTIGGVGLGLVAGALADDLFGYDDEWNPFVFDVPPTIEEWPIGTCDFEVEPYLDGDLAVQSFLRSMGMGSWLTSMPTRYPSIRVEGGSRA